MTSTTSILAFFSLPGGTEWIVILVIGLLLFGRRLPEVGRSIGQGIKEFKKGLKDTEDEVKRESPAASRPALPQDQTMSTPTESRERTQAH
jgi:sec-independent protein translocase protein TatA